MLSDWMHSSPPFPPRGDEKPARRRDKESRRHTKGHRGSVPCTAHRLKIAKFSRRITRIKLPPPRINFAKLPGSPSFANYVRRSSRRRSLDRLEIFTALLQHLFGFHAKPHKRKSVSVYIMYRAAKVDVLTLEPRP